MFKRRNTLLRSILRHDGRLFEAFLDLALYLFEDGITRLIPHSFFRGVLRHDAPLFGAEAQQAPTG